MSEKPKEGSGSWNPDMDCEYTWVMVLAYVNSRDFKVDKHGELKSVTGAIEEALSDAFERNGLRPGQFGVAVERDLHTLDSARDLCVEMTVADPWPSGKIRGFLMRQWLGFCLFAARGFKADPKTARRS